MSRLYALGELLIDFQSVGHLGLKDTDTFVKKAGGAPANVAAQAAKLGREVSYLTKVGKDGFGDFLVASLQEAGVDTSFVRQSEDYPTSLAFVSIREDGEREFSFYRQNPADLNIEKEDCGEVDFGKGDILEFGSVALATAKSRATHDFLIDKAKGGGAIVAFDPNLRFSLWKDQDELKDIVRTYLRKADIVKIGKDELEWLCEGKAEDNAAKMVEQGTRILLLTDGSKGAKLFVKGSVYACPGYKVEAVDATGAGDSFFGAFLSKYMEYREKETDIPPYQEMLNFACKAGAYTTTGYGAIPSMGSQAQIERKVS